MDFKRFGLNFSMGYLGAYMILFLYLFCIFCKEKDKDNFGKKFIFDFFPSILGAVIIQFLIGIFSEKVKEYTWSLMLLFFVLVMMLFGIYSQNNKKGKNNETK